MLAELREKAVDAFSLQIIDGAEHALADRENPLRANFFSTAMRMLFEHIMDTLSPIEEVMKSSWYKAEKPDGKPTRAQRIKFAVQGGFEDAFVASELKVDLAPLSRKLLASIDALSKQVHGRENTVITDLAEQDTLAVATTAAMYDFLEAAEECRKALILPVEEGLDSVAVDALLAETLQDVDEIASHYSLEEVYVEKIAVLCIGAASIVYRATGSIAVILQWGSNSDVRKGDGAELPQSFPFVCDITLPIDDPWDLSFAETTYGVDTSEWREAMQPEDDER